MNEYSVSKARAEFSKVLAKVQTGREVVITLRGAPIARICGVGGARRPINLAVIDAFRESLPMQKKGSVEQVRSLRDERY